MTENFDQILDKCIDGISRGESLDACLARYPEHARQLEPLLRAMAQTREAYSFVPSADARRVARQRFNVALEQLEQRRRQKKSWFRVFARPRVWATVAVTIAVLLVAYFGFSPALYPPIEPVPNPEGNFVFLISDEVNAIADFESLMVSISRVGLYGDSGQRIEFTPEVKEVDLTQLQGDKTQEIWRGDVPEGHYSRVFIYVTDVRGVLKETGQTVEVKLPSNKLHLSSPFQVVSGSVTSFTYDLTVVASGNAQSGIKYHLKPQIGESGADTEPKDKNKTK